MSKTIRWCFTHGGVVGEDARVLDDSPCDVADALVVRLPIDYEVAAAAGHEAYERHAPDFNYHTRRETRVPWGELPSMMRWLMRLAYRAGINAALGIGDGDG